MHYLFAEHLVTKYLIIYISYVHVFFKLVFVTIAKLYQELHFYKKVEERWFKIKVMITLNFLKTIKSDFHWIIQFVRTNCH